MAAALTATARPTARESGLLTLEVPYFSQRDSATTQGDRMCFSSTCAMAAEFLKPDCLAGAGQRDDRYLALVQRFGDTTNSQAQVAALRRLGIQATFRTDGRIEQLIAQLRLGFPIPVGWLHHGPVSAPSGGGHWSLGVGIRRLDGCSCTTPMGRPTSWGVGMSPPPSAAARGSGTRSGTGAGGGWWMVEGVGSGWWLELGG